MPRRSGASASRRAVEGTRPLALKRAIEMAADEAEQRRFAGAARPHDRRASPGQTAKRQIADRRAPLIESVTCSTDKSGAGSCRRIARGAGDEHRGASEARAIDGQRKERLQERRDRREAAVAAVGERERLGGQRRDPPTACEKGRKILRDETATPIARASASGRQQDRQLYPDEAASRQRAQQPRPRGRSEDRARAMDRRARAGHRETQTSACAQMTAAKVPSSRSAREQRLDAEQRRRVAAGATEDRQRRCRRATARSSLSRQATASASAAAVETTVSASVRRGGAPVAARCGADSGVQLSGNARGNGQRQAKDQRASATSESEDPGRSAPSAARASRAGDRAPRPPASKRAATQRATSVSPTRQTRIAPRRRQAAASPPPRRKRRARDRATGTSEGPA